MLMYSGAMSGVSDSVIEAAKLDGITPIREFFYIIVPLIYPTLVTFLVVEVAGIFTNQMNLYNFYGLKAEYSLYTFGYFLYKGNSERQHFRLSVSRRDGSCPDCGGRSAYADRQESPRNSGAESVSRGGK